MSADFTFDASSPAVIDDLLPLYRHILGHDAAKPTVDLGGITEAAATAWLRAAHARYAQAVGKRSDMLVNMDLPARVTLVGLAVQL